MKRIQFTILALFLAGSAFVGAAFAETGTAAVAPPVQLTADQQVAFGQLVAIRGEKLSQRVGHMLDDARREADIIKVTCVDHKLTEINATLGDATNHLTLLTKAVDTDARNHEYTVITVLGSCPSTSPLMSSTGWPRMPPEAFRSSTAKTVP